MKKTQGLYLREAQGRLLQAVSDAAERLGKKRTWIQEDTGHHQ